MHLQHKHISKSALSGEVLHLTSELFNFPVKKTAIIIELDPRMLRNQNDENDNNYYILPQYRSYYPDDRYIL